MEGRKESVQFNRINCKENQKRLCNRSYRIRQGVFSTKGLEYHRKGGKRDNSCA